MSLTKECEPPETSGSGGFLSIGDGDLKALQHIQHLFVHFRVAGGNAGGIHDDLCLRIPGLQHHRIADHADVAHQTHQLNAVGVFGQDILCFPGFHAKGIPGSHVIVKTEGRELPDKTFEEAGRLAAHYSKGSKSEKVEIDYLKRKDVKKPNGSKPGFVVYYTNYSMMSYSDIEGIKAVEET